MIYVKFDNAVEDINSHFDAINADTGVGHTPNRGEIVYWPTTTTTTPPPLPNYFRIISRSNDNTIRFSATTTSTSVVGKVIEVSTDDGLTWTSKSSSTGGTVLGTLQVGDTMLIRGDNSTYSTGTAASNIFTSSGNFELSGNIMSLISSSDFEGLNDLSGTWAFANMFSSCTGLVSVDNLIIPATGLTEGCYYQTFIGCSFVNPLQLPATTLAPSCYRGMFNRCANMTNPPLLAPTVLASGCYRYMFAYCTALTSAPELPAQTLVDQCYFAMFSGCTNLNYIKCLATSVSASQCKESWVAGVSSSGTFVKSSSITTSTWGSGTSGIPSNWTVQDAS